MLEYFKLEDGRKVLQHPLASCSASGQRFERPMTELKELEA